MSGYTRLSCLFWEWSRLNQLSPTTRLLWLALYTSPTAKRGVPALWHGSVITMAEAARLPCDETARALDSLIDHDLAEYDPQSLVLRLTELPDAGEWPSAPAILDSWFKRFRMVPACGVRDAHVLTIRWILERGALEADKNHSGKPSLKHEEIWGRTFATIRVPSPRRRGVRRFGDNNDTSTDVQPGLFSAPLRASREGLAATSDARSVDNSDTLHQSNKIIVRETHPSGSGEGEGEGEGVSGSGVGSGEGGSGGGNNVRKKGFVLTVVDGIGFDVDDLIDALAVASGGKFPRALPRESREALQAAIDSAARISRTPGALACLREYIARGMEGFPKQALTADERSRPGGEIAPEVVAAPGWLALAIQHAVAWKQKVDEQVALAAAARKELGFE